MFERKNLKTLQKRIAEPRKFIQIVMGPRQVGKTTMLSQLCRQLETPTLLVSADGISAADANWL